MQDSFLIEDWYHFEISEHPVGTGRDLVRSPKTAARALLQTALDFTDPPLAPWSFALLLDAASEEKLQAGSLSPIIT